MAVNYSNYQELFEKDKNGLYLANTNDLQQSRFLPLLQHAEVTIKKLITKNLMTLGNIYDLRFAINKYIQDFAKDRLPLDIENRESYIRGLYAMANKVYNELNKQRKEFSIVLGLIVGAYTLKGLKLPKIETPEQLSNFIVKNTNVIKKIELDMWSQAKASIRVLDYPKQIQKYIDKASKIPTTAIEDGKKPISIWQKAELDIRHEKQMKMVEEAQKSGDDLYYISSHPDCSKRCEKWQGCLVSVTKHAENPQTSVKNFNYNKKRFQVGTVDGIPVYSLKDIMACETGYGYNNNIIGGFNCRHHLIKYQSGKSKPKEYSAEDVKRMREINDKIREAERHIRELKTEQEMYRQVGDRKNYWRLNRDIINATNELREYCNKNGFAFQEYRIK